MNQSSKVIPTPHPAMPPGEQEVRAALSQLRQKLLDLTARNPLISFKHGKSARYIRIVDELPDRLTEELYAGTSLSSHRGVQARLPAQSNGRRWRRGPPIAGSQFPLICLHGRVEGNIRT